jgi:hypothetical protein
VNTLYSGICVRGSNFITKPLFYISGIQYSLKARMLINSEENSNTFPHFLTVFWKSVMSLNQSSSANSMRMFLERSRLENSLCEGTIESMENATHTSTMFILCLRIVHRGYEAVSSMFESNERISTKLGILFVH